MRIRNELPIVEGRAIPKERRNEGGGVGTGGEPTAGGGSHQELNRDQEPKRQMKRGEVNSRNYQFFARLASVRGDGRDPQGLPDDVSEMVQMFADGWAGDGHSHSWLSASDFADDYYGVEAIESGEEEPMTEYHQNTLSVDKNYAVLQFLQEMCGVSGIADVTQANEFRFVFWFDN